jgi:hypothetical protein
MNYSMMVMVVVVVVAYEVVAWIKLFVDQYEEIDYSTMEMELPFVHSLVVLVELEELKYHYEFLGLKNYVRLLLVSSVLPLKIIKINQNFKNKISILLVDKPFAAAAAVVVVAWP